MSARKLRNDCVFGNRGVIGRKLECDDLEDSDSSSQTEVIDMESPKPGPSKRKERDPSNQNEKYRCKKSLRKKKKNEDIAEPMGIDNLHEEDWRKLNGFSLEGNLLVSTTHATAQASRSLDRTKHYFTTQIVKRKHRDCNSDCVIIGVSKKSFFPSGILGRSKGTVGYYSATGYIYCGRMTPALYLKKFTEGDIVGCGITYPEDLTNSDKDSSGDLSDSSDSSAVKGELKFDPRIKAKHYYLSHNENESDDDFPEDEIKLVNRNQANVEFNRQEKPRVLVYFTCNGRMVGMTNVYIPEDGLYPTVQTLSSGINLLVDLDPLTG